MTVRRGPGKSLDTRLIILEGIMGTGKSTTARWLAGQLRANGFPVTVFGNRKMWGRTPPDALRAALLDVADPRRLWDELQPSDLIRRSRDAWSGFVREALERPGISLLDGRFFHADLAGLLMMEVPEAEIREHASWIVHTTRPLKPHLVYLHPGDIGEGLRRISAIRGRTWATAVSSRVRSDAPWSLARLESPYHQRRSLRGVEGTVTFYKDYVDLCERLLPELEVPFLHLETGGGKWPACRTEIARFLGIPPARDLGYLAWWATKRPRLWLSRTLGNLRAAHLPGT